MIAISVSLTDTARVAGFINPGTRRGDLPQRHRRRGQTFTRLLLERGQVIAVGSTTTTQTTTTTPEGTQTDRAAAPHADDAGARPGATPRRSCSRQDPASSRSPCSPTTATSSPGPAPPPTTCSGDLTCLSSSTRTPDTVNALLPTVPAGAHAIDQMDRLQRVAGPTGPRSTSSCSVPTWTLADALALADGMRLTRPSTSVVLVRDEVDAHDHARGDARRGPRRRTGLATPTPIRAAVDRAYQLYVALRGPGGAMHQGRIVTVFSPKGGVGKTTVSVNLALALADRGARKVCLVDLDLAFGDVAITLQLFPSHTIEHAIGSEDAIDAPLLESLLTRHADSVMVLAAPNHPDVRERVTPMLVSRILKALRESFDFIVVDTAPAFDEQTLTALDETDECVIVATLDVPTLKNVKVALETLEMLDIARDHRHLLLNRADDNVGLGRGAGRVDPRHAGGEHGRDLHGHRGRHQRRPARS